MYEEQADEQWMVGGGADYCPKCGQHTALHTTPDCPGDDDYHEVERGDQDGEPRHNQYGEAGYWV